MDILLLMLLIWGYNEQPKDAKEEVSRSVSPFSNKYKY